MEKSNNNEKLTKVGINWYPGHMAKTKREIKENISLVDIVYEVIDSRIPYSSKIKDIDDLIHDKPRILIMSKYDICDKSETNKWVKYYENKGYYVICANLFEDIAYKISNLTDELLIKLKDKRTNKGITNDKFRALVIGVPNVGKSTLINSLSGKKKVETGNKPGVTKKLNWISVNEKLELLDTPGILWPRFDNQEIAYNLAAMTAIKDTVLDIFDISVYILNKLNEYYPEKLLERYGVMSINDDIVETLDIIGKKYGCIISGGEIDYDRVCNIIVNDIKSSKINGITFDKYKAIIK